MYIYKNFRIKSTNFPEEDHRGNIKNVPDDKYKTMNGIIFDEVIEEELFGKHKYEPKQTSVMFTYQP